MTFGGGKEAADTRWAEQEAKMNELERMAYANLPQEEVTQRIPTIRKYRLSNDLGKVELPQYESVDPLDETKIVKVYAVNDDYVRNNLEPSMDFVSGHHWSNEFIPEQEIWLGKSIRDRDIFFIHEFDERTPMAKGMPYEEAHEKVANVSERKARQSPTLARKMVSERVMQPIQSIKEPEYNSDNTTQTDYNIDEGMADYQQLKKQMIIHKVKINEKQEAALPTKYYMGRPLRPVNVNARI
jgi:hypothetical protein